jgi:hypothetical protein
MTLAGLPLAMMPVLRRAITAEGTGKYPVCRGWQDRVQEWQLVPVRMY